MRKQVNYCDDLNDDQFNSMVMMEEGESSALKEKKGRLSRRNMKAEEGNNSSVKGEDNRGYNDDLEGDQDFDQEDVYM